MQSIDDFFKSLYLSKGCCLCYRVPVLVILQNSIEFLVKRTNELYFQKRTHISKLCTSFSCCFLVRSQKIFYLTHLLLLPDHQENAFLTSLPSCKCLLYWKCLPAPSLPFTSFQVLSIAPSALKHNGENSSGVVPWQELLLGSRLFASVLYLEMNGVRALDKTWKCRVRQVCKSVTA